MNEAQATAMATGTLMNVAQELKLESLYIYTNFPSLLVAVKLKTAKNHQVTK